jgi:hypothetical protein
VLILNNLKLFRINICWSSPVGNRRIAQFWCNVTPFRINTSKSVSNGRTLSPLRINTYEKTGEGAVKWVLARLLPDGPVPGWKRLSQMRRDATQSVL